MSAIRLARADEADAIERLYIGARNEMSTWTAEYPGRFEIDEDIKNGALWALEERGGIIACVSIIDYDDVSDMDADWSEGAYRIMARLCSARAVQGRGAARELLTGVCAHLSCAGYKYIRYLCAKKNVYAMRLYDKMGVRRLGSTFIYGHDFIICEQRTEVSS